MQILQTWRRCPWRVCFSHEIPGKLLCAHVTVFTTLSFLEPCSPLATSLKSINKTPVAVPRCGSEAVIMHLTCFHWMCMNCNGVTDWLLPEPQKTLVWMGRLSWETTLAVVQKRELFLILGKTWLEAGKGAFFKRWNGFLQGILFPSLNSGSAENAANRLGGAES